RRLQRRVTELGSLQAVGQALSASLDVEVIVTAIYDQVANLMPTPSFYLALYDAQLDEVSFPMVIDEGVPRQSEARRARHGLTEYVLETGEPLLLAEDVRESVAALGLEHIGRPAQCWLGIPIVAGDEVLGMMALQSYDQARLYDQSHVEILQTIAAQAAVAIQNARLYERTDEALARRVQELDSVLRTTQDGVLLIDLEWRVLAVNRALANLVGIAQRDFARHPIDALRPGGEPLIALIHYTPEALTRDCARLMSGAVDEIQDVVVFGRAAQASSLHVARTLTPVRDNHGEVNGWLLVFRDLTEELELARLREDMIDMLVHDLRSPLSLVMASLGMLQEASDHQDGEQIDRLLSIAQRSSDRILTLIDQLLDISQLERGQLPMKLESTAVDGLLREVSSRYLPVAAAHGIAFDSRADEGLPMVFVDRALIVRVLSNLVDNALKFTPDGGDVTIWSTPDEEDSSGKIRIAVRDTGPGIPVESWPQLFEKFQQVPNIRGRRRGTGLGLPFCRLVVEAHGGKIWVDSRVGEGSTFLFTLPIDGTYDS
ncbi:MAG: GAF domain-containing protein, partial [Anaerolineae bacterium]|nr:GAF domain-containing protein [Anaerolineae bacterium]